jgi:ribonuclease Z
MEEMVNFAKDADVLIHESTFDSSLPEIPSEYGHTTALQAADIAKKANVQKLFLTHISPRYLDDKVIENDAKKAFKNSFVPKDFEEFEVKLKK